jgi:hypothetical protein
VETPTNESAPSQPKRPVVEFLKRYLEMAEKGEITSVVLGYISSKGGAALQSTPMSPIMLNHLSKLLDRRVNREYDQAMAQASEPRATTGAGAVPAKSRQEAHLPRNVRRAFENRQKKLVKQATKKAARKKVAESVLANPPPPVAASK